MDKKIVFINYDKTETGVKIDVANEYWQLFQDLVSQGAGETYKIIFEDNAKEATTEVDSNLNPL